MQGLPSLCDIEMGGEPHIIVLAHTLDEPF
jgi:hypothetical protein